MLCLKGISSLEHRNKNRVARKAPILLNCRVEERTRLTVWVSALRCFTSKRSVLEVYGLVNDIMNMRQCGCANSGAWWSLLEAGGDDGVEEGAEEVEPFLLGDLAITIGIEGGEKFINFSSAVVLIGVLGETKTVLSELVDFSFVNETVAVEIELVESSSGGGEGVFTGLINSLLVGGLHL